MKKYELYKAKTAYTYAEEDAYWQGVLDTRDMLSNYLLGKGEEAKKIFMAVRGIRIPHEISYRLTTVNVPRKKYCANYAQYKGR